MDMEIETGFQYFIWEAIFLVNYIFYNALSTRPDFKQSVHT